VRHAADFLALDYLSRSRRVQGALRASLRERHSPTLDPEARFTLASSPQ
jgi:hypothetical protein